MNYLKQFLFFFFRRQTTYRIGRALYKKARGDHLNEMTLNGETLIQNCVVDAWKNGDLRGQHLVVFDVGANVGDWSDAFMSLLPESAMRGTVSLHVFEPVPSTFEFLKQRLGIQNPVLHYEQVALSSTSGEGFIYTGGPNAGTNSLHADSLKGNEHRVAITTLTPDDFCERHKLEVVHLLKCDTEGHDMEVIRGALPLLEKESISVLQFEYNHRWVFSRNYLRDVFVAIEGLPYRLAKLQQDCLLVFNEWHPELERFFEGNYALIHLDAVDWFPIKTVSWDHCNTMRIESK